MQEFQEHATRLGDEPYSEAQVQAAERQYKQLLGKYGPRFGGCCGAHATLVKRNLDYARKNVTFAALEASVGTLSSS